MQGIPCTDCSSSSYSTLFFILTVQAEKQNALLGLRLVSSRLQGGEG